MNPKIAFFKELKLLSSNSLSGSFVEMNLLFLLLSSTFLSETGQLFDRDPIKKTNRSDVR
jgi:hypothetical protein